MKKIITVTLLAFSLTIFSQEETTLSKVKFGAKTGLNISSASVDLNTSGWGADESYSTKSYTGFHLGFFAEYAINDKMKLQPELLYSRQGYKLNFKDDYINDTNTYKLNYLVAPLMFKYNIIDNLYAEAGLNIALLIGGENEYKSVYDASGTEYDSSETITEDLPDNFSNLDLGMNIGASYQYNKFLFGLRYTLGLTNLNSFDGTDDLKSDKSRNFAISVGYFFM